MAKTAAELKTGPAFVPHIFNNKEAVRYKTKIAQPLSNHSMIFEEHLPNTIQLPTCLLVDYWNNENWLLNGTMLTSFGLK